jgi:curved DNA-binding protein CbpA
MNKVAGASPTAHGSLEQTPLAHLLVYMAEKRLSGTIVFTPKDGSASDETMIRFVEGEACSVSGGSFEACCRLPDTTTFAFYDGQNIDNDSGTTRIPEGEPLATIWSAVRARGLDRVVEAALGRLGPRVLKLHDQSRPDRFGFTLTELSIADALRARPRSMAELLASGLAPPHSLKLVIYALLITRHIDHGSAPPVGVARSSERPRAEGTLSSGSQVAIARVNLVSKRADSGHMPSSGKTPIALSPALAARKEEILKRSGQIDREDYFSMLGVDRAAATPEIETNYYAMVKVWHPDRLPPELAGLRDAVSKVFARITEAFQTLSDPARKKRYLDVLKGGGGTPEEADKMQRIIDAATDFQRGEILWRNRDPNAEKFIVRAYRADPQQGDYAALYVSLELSKRAPEAPVDDLLKLCDQAIEGNERCERAYFCRAQIKRRLGKIESSIADFRSAFELNPKNLDAGREVRLYEMRRSKQPERRSTPAPHRSTPPGAPTKSNPPRLSSKPPKTASSSRPATKEKEGGVFSGIGKLFKR